MLTLIGSTAARMHFSDFRTSNDVDYHTPVAQDVDDWPEFDVFVDERLGAWTWRKIATPEELYTMKVSHSFWDIDGSWDKHAADIVFFQRKGVQFNRELYDILLPIWKDIHGRKVTSLKQNAADFFGDAVPRKYVHDSIHDSVAYGDRPMYESILADGEEVMVDSSKFWGMDHEDQIRLIREEIYATALERIVIPNDYSGSPGAAYRFALKKSLTSLFKNDWALFIALNLDELGRPDCDYVKRHLENSNRLILLED